MKKTLQMLHPPFVLPPLVVGGCECAVCSIPTLRKRSAVPGTAAARRRGMSDRPHILLVLIDDFGWANAGWHRNYTAPGGSFVPATAEVATPHMNRLGHLWRKEEATFREDARFFGHLRGHPHKSQKYALLEILSWMKVPEKNLKCMGTER